jgi:phenylacetate-CoA ligase
MPVRQPKPAELEPIERARPAELQALQLERMRWSLNHAYGACRTTARVRRRGVRPSDLKTLADLARFPFTKRPTCGDLPLFDVRGAAEKVVRIHASSGTTGKPTVVGYTAKDIDTWSNVMARSIRAAGATRRRQGSRGLRLWPLYRGTRRPLRRGEAGAAP